MKLSNETTYVYVVTEKTDKDLKLLSLILKLIIPIVG